LLGQRRQTFIILIEQQRLNIAATADAMHKLFHHGDCIKANRWAKHFSAVAKASSRHSLVVYRLFQQVFSTPLQLPPPRDLHHILELLVELQAENDESLQPETVECLSSIKSSGKAKKHIEQLIGK